MTAVSSLEEWGANAQSLLIIMRIAQASIWRCSWLEDQEIYQASNKDARLAINIYL